MRSRGAATNLLGGGSTPPPEVPGIMFMPARLPGHGRALRTLHNCLLGVSYGPDFYALLAAQQADDGGDGRNGKRGIARM